MALKITRGKQAAPVRAVIHGTEGIGKTTLASQFPNALILDTEDGSRHLDAARVSCPDFITLEGAIHELVRDSQGFGTVVIDSADWAERSLIEQILKGTGKRSIEEFGFGKGYVMLQERVGKFLALCDQLIARGVHVVFVAHSKVQRTSPPDQTDGYDRYELKLTKQVAPLFKEWADLLVFCNYRTKLVEGNDGRMKATGGRERVMFTERAAAWDAKNRYGLAPELPMGIEHLRTIFAVPAAEVKVKPACDGIVARAVVAITKATTREALDPIRSLIDTRLQEGAINDAEAEELLKLAEDRESSLIAEVATN